MSQFGVQLGAFCRKAGARADLAARYAGLMIFERVILRTPVDTGRARANWQATVGQPAEGQLELFDPSGSGAVAGAQAAALGWNLAAGSLFLANNLPYIEPLENGWSQQAPAGMVRLTLMEFQELVDQAAERAITEAP